MQDVRVLRGYYPECTVTYQRVTVRLFTQTEHLAIDGGTAVSGEEFQNSV